LPALAGSPTDPTLSLASAPTYDLPPMVEVAAAPAPRRFAPGRQLGDLLLVRPLGAGGFGEVWEAEVTRDQRRVALKLLTEDLSASARKRFRREGRIAASIHHPRVDFLFSAEELEGVPALAMELLPGGTLKDLVERSGPLSWKDAVARLLELVDGLEAAHAKGILHRDIKPSNCFLDERGQVKIGDFGLSRPTEGGDDDTKTGTYVGTPAYSSPEQVKGAKLDMRSDLFSLGATFYFLLSGRAPFEGETLGRVLSNVPTAEPEPLAGVGFELPRGLEEVVERLLAKSAGDRFADYTELRSALAFFTGPDPGELAPRAVAYAVDNALVSLAAALLLRLGALAGLPVILDAPPGSVGCAPDVFRLTLEFGYFLAFELWLGRSLGELLFGLEVRRADGSALGARSAGGRAFSFVALSSLPAALFDLPVTMPYYVASGALRLVQHALTSILEILMPRSLVLSSMRRANGFAGLHELLTATRAVRSRAVERCARARDLHNQGSDDVAQSAKAIGPYRVLRTIGTGRDRQLWLGMDSILKRFVWLAAPAPNEDLRPTSLPLLQTLELNGMRWSVFTAPDGAPLVALRPRGREDARRASRAALASLAEELARQRTGARYSLAEIWVTEDSRSLLLPFPAPGLDPGALASTSEPAPADELLRSAAACVGPWRSMSSRRSLVPRTRSSSTAAATSDPTATTRPEHARGQSTTISIRRERAGENGTRASMVWAPRARRQRAVYGRSAVANGTPSTYQTSCGTAGSTSARRASVFRSVGASGSKSRRSPGSGATISIAGARPWASARLSARRAASLAASARARLGSPARSAQPA
jgi:hypothetical protein